MKVLKRILEFLKQEKSIPWVLLIITIGVGLQRAIGGPEFYNNFTIFKTSFFHLIHNQDLYLRYPKEYDDLFLYTPTFALLMFPFVYLPAFVQVFAWCGLTSFLGYSAIKAAPLSDSKKRAWILWLIFFEFITAMQCMQTAGMVASLIIIGFASLEKGNVGKAALFILLAAFIKIYALAALVMFLLYPKKAKFILLAAFWTVILLALPLVVISFKQLISLYQSWYHLTLGVHQSEEASPHPNIILSLSVMSWLKTWFNISLPVIYVQVTGTAILLLPLLRYKLYKILTFRAFFLASILIWSMIFNHIAESASYIVAVFGVAVWFVNEKLNWFSIMLMILAFVFTTLESTDMFTPSFRQQYFIPYVIKAVPCIFVWGVLQYRLLFTKDYVPGKPISQSA